MSVGGVRIIDETGVTTVNLGMRGPVGPAGDARPAIYFDHGDATPAVLDTPGADQVIRSVTLAVVTAFNGTGARVSIGTDAEPELLMEEDLTDLSVIATYEAFPMVTIPAGTPIKAFITAGGGASTGRCMVLFNVANA